MILMLIDNGQVYEHHRRWPALVCPNTYSAHHATKQFNAWRDELVEHLRATDDDCTSEAWTAWFAQHQPPFWHKESYPEVYDIVMCCFDGDNICDLSIVTQQITVYEPEEHL